MTRSSIALLLVVGLPLSDAHAQRTVPPITPNSRLTFSFADPAPGKQLIVGPGNKVADASFGYDPEARVNFIVGSNDGAVPTTVFQDVFVEMNLDVYVTGIPRGGPGPLIGFVGGSFTVYAVSSRGRFDILRATLPTVFSPDGIVGQGGQLFLVGPLPAGPLTGAIISSSNPFTLDYKAGPLLSAILDPLGVVLAPAFDAVFTITDLDPGAAGDPRGANPSQPRGNASFSGTAALIPTPGMTALFAVAGLVSLRRRR